MKNTYDEFINSLNIITEGDFKELMDILPDEDIDFNDIDWTDNFCYVDDLNDMDYIAAAIINEILKQWEYAYCDTADFEERTFVLEDCNSLDDLNEIIKTFKEWRISNFDEVKKGLEEEEMEIIKERKHTEYNTLFYNLSPTEVDEILEKYGNKK